MVVKLSGSEKYGSEIHHTLRTQTRSGKTYYYFRRVNTAKEKNQEIRLFFFAFIFIFSELLDHRFRQ